MTAKTYATLLPNAGGNLIVGPSGLRVDTGGAAAGAQMALGNTAQMSGTSSFEVYVFSVLRVDLASYASVGVAQPDCSLNNIVGGDGAGKSWGFVLGLGQVWNAGANTSGTSTPAAERDTITVQLSLSPSLCTCTWYVNGTAVHVNTLPNGKAWVPAISLGAGVGDTLSAVINFGQDRFDKIITAGWFQKAPGLDALYLSLVNDGFLTASTDTPANTPYSPYILNAASISAKRNPLPWFYRSGGSYNPASVSSIQLRNDDGTFNQLIGADVRDSPVVLRIVDAPKFSAGTLTSSTPVISGIIDKVTQQTASTVSLALRDSLALYDVPLPCRIVPAYYDPASAGKIFPIGLGSQRNVQPLFLEQLTYALGDAPMTNIARVSDMAAPLSPNALPPQYTTALNGAGFTLATDPVGRLSADCSSKGTQYNVPGAADVLAGAGKFKPWNPPPDAPPKITTSPPTGWTWSGSAGSQLVKQANVMNPTDSYQVGMATVLPWQTNPTYPRYGDYLKSATPILVAGRSYRLTLKLVNVYAEAPNNYSSGKFQGGLMVRSALTPDAASAISPNDAGINTAGGYQNAYSFLYTVPAGANRYLYLMAVGSSGPTPITSPGCTINVSDVTVELLEQQQTLPLDSISMLDAVTEIMVTRFGADQSVFSATDCALIDNSAKYGVGVRWEDQPNTLDCLLLIADEYDAVIYTDANNLIRFKTLTLATDGPVVAAFDESNFDVNSLRSYADDPMGLTTNFGARHNWTPFTDSDFVTDDLTVTANTKARFKGTSQFNLSANGQLASEYSAARGAGRLHTLIDDPAKAQGRAEVVVALFADKHVTRTFTAFYDDLSLGIGPACSPFAIGYNDKITITSARNGWTNEIMTVIGWEVMPGANQINLTVRH